MTDNELRKLKRTDLLEMLIEQSKKADELQNQVNRLEKQLSDRQICLNRAGTIAEAAFAMNGVLEAAEAAAQQYLDNLKSLEERQQADFIQKEAESNKLLDDARLQAKAMMDETKAKCTELENTVQMRCETMLQETEDQCNGRIQDTKKECISRIRETETKCSARERETEAKCADRERVSEEKCREMTERAERETEARWSELSVKLENFYQAHEGLRELLTATGGIQREKA